MQKWMFTDANTVFLGLLFTIMSFCIPSATAETNDRKWINGNSIWKELPDVETEDSSLHEALEPYENERQTFSWKLKELERANGYRRSILQYQSPVQTDIKENRTVKGSYYRPSGKGSFPGVIVIHHAGGEDSLMEKLSKKLARQNYAVLKIWLPHYGPRAARNGPKYMSAFMRNGSTSFVRAFRQSVQDLRMAFDWLSQRPETSKTRIGMAGFSLGAMIGALLLGVHQRFSRAVLVLGSGNILSLLKQPVAKKFFPTQPLKQLLREENLASKLKTIEPLTFAPRVRDDTVLMINGTVDMVIPDQYVRNLQRAMGDQHIQWYLTGHQSLQMIQDRVFQRGLQFMEKLKQ